MPKITGTGTPSHAGVPVPPQGFDQSQFFNQDRFITPEDRELEEVNEESTEDVATSALGTPTTPSRVPNAGTRKRARTGK